MPDTRPHVAIIESTGKYFLMMVHDRAQRQFAVHAFEGLLEGIRHFEGGYADCFSRGRTWETSATLHWMFFQPSIVHVPGEEIALLLGSKPVQIQSLRNMAGHMYVLELDDEKGRQAWESGDKPKLLPETMQTAKSTAGFTLIELLIVIVIIAMIGFLGVMAFKTAKAAIGLVVIVCFVVAILAWFLRKR